MARVFVSHSSRDGKASVRLKEWLLSQGFDAPFLDFDKHSGIPPGAEWEKTLYREISSCEAMVIVQTPNWLTSKWCFAEFTQARALGKPIFPLIEGPTGETLVAGDIQALDLRSDREKGLAQLARELTRIALDAQGGFAWDSRRAPYPGLMAFEADDAAIYFGRDDDIRRLIERLNARRVQGGARLLAVLGASGSGKSSLLRAGVLPRLARDRRGWCVVSPVRPQLFPIGELARAMALAVGRPETWRDLRDALLEGDPIRPVDDWAQDLRLASGSTEGEVLLVVDQAEELFGTSDPGEAARFEDVIAEAVSARLPITVVLAMRSDFLEPLQRSPRLGGLFEEFSLGPLPLSRIPQIIEGPARVAGLDVDDELVMEATRDAATEDALPLLAFALRELHDRFGKDGRLTAEDYRALGDPVLGLSPLENAVRKAADLVLEEARPTETELLALKEAFVPALVRVNDSGEYVRRPALWRDLPEAAHGLLDRLVQARLLVRRQDNEATVVEVTHEALLRKWPRLRAWLDEERAFLIGRQQLEQDLHDWQQASSADKPGALLAGLKLARAASWLAERAHQLSGDERGFIEASIAKARAEEHRRTRARWLVTGGALASAALLAALAVFGLQQAGRAQAEAERAVIAADRALDLARISQAAEWQAQDPSRAGLILAELKEPDTTLARRRMSELLALPLVSAELLHAGPVARAEFSPGGGRLVTLAGADDRLDDLSGLPATQARVWDPSSGRAVTDPLDHPEEVRVAAISADDRSLLTVAGQEVRVWDIDSGATRWTRAFPQPVSSAAFAGRRPAVAVATGAEVWLHDAQTGEALTEQPWRHEAEIWRIASVPGRDLVAVVTKDGRVSVRDVASEVVRTFAFESVGPVAWNSSGSQLGIAEADDLTVWDAARDMARSAEFEDHIEGLWFSDDGESVVVSTGRGDLSAGSVGSSSAITMHRLPGVDSQPLAADVSRGTLRLLLGTGTSPGFSEYSIYGLDRVATNLTSINVDEGSVVGSNDLEVAENLLRGAFAPDGRLLATISGTTFGAGRMEVLRPDNVVRLWNVETLRGRLARSLEGGAPEFDRTGALVLTIDGSVVHLQRTSSGEPHPLGALQHQDPVRSAAFHPDGSVVATLAGGEILLHPLAASAGDGPTQTLPAQSGDTVAFSDDGVRLIAERRGPLIMSQPELVGIWRSETGDDMRPEALSACDGSGHLDRTGRMLVQSCDVRTRAWLLEGDAFAPAGSAIPWRLPPLHASSASSGLLAVAGDEGVEIRDVRTGEVAMRRPADESGVLWLAAQPEGARFAIAMTSGAVELVDPGTQGVVTLEGSPSDTRLTGLEFSPDGRHLLAEFESFGQGGSLRIWRTDDGSRIGDVPLRGGAEAWRLGSDGDSLLTWSDREARLWSIETAEPLFDEPFSHPWAEKTASWMPTGDIAGGAVAADRAYVATSTDKGTLLWAVGGRELQQTLRATIGGCLSVAFRQSVLAESAEQARENVEACRDRISGEPDSPEG